jgi:hypothetical protein
VALGLEPGTLGMKKHFIAVPELKAKPVEPKEAKPKAKKPVISETKA